MQSRKRFAVGVGVLLVGFCAALPFQRRPDPTSDASGTGDSRETTISDLILRPTDVTLEASLPSDRSPAAGLLNESNDSQVEQRPVRRHVSLENAAPPPHLASAYPQKDGARESLSPDSAPRRKPKAGALVDVLPEEPRRHRIVDGDTLRGLAKRYLGSEDRQWEIYRANTDLLSHPEVLPVGIEIRIPAKRPDPPSDVIPLSRLMPPAIQPFAPAPVRTNSELIAVPDGSAGREAKE